MNVFVIFDIETTGLDRTKDQIIQFAAIKVDIDTNEVIDSMTQLIKPVGNYSISIGAYFKHHITPEILNDKPHMFDVASDIVKFFENVDNILTYNGNGFDIPFLKTELNKYGFDIDFSSKNLYDAFLEEKRRNGISLENTYLRYTGKQMNESNLTAHDALSDVKATLAVFNAQQKINSYGPEQSFGDDNIIVEMDFNGKLQPCFNIGKYKGISVEYVSSIDKNYIRWCVGDKCNFMKSTKEYLQQYL